MVLPCKADSLNRSRCRSKVPRKKSQTESELAENAAKELESLSEYMLNISDIEAGRLLCGYIT